MILFGDIFDVLGGLVGLALFVLWVVRQIIDANKQAPPARGRQAGAAPRPQAAGGGAPQGGGQADPLRNQVEEFLRRAGRGPQANQPQRPAGADEVELLIDDEVRPAQSRRLADPMRPLEARTSDSSQPGVPLQPVAKPSKQRRQRRSVVSPKRETLAERAAQREGERARKLAEQAAQLGQRIIAEDRQFDVQIQAKFDRSVGTLASTTAEVAEPAAKIDSPAGSIAAMLASPDGVRQAIILNEILRRPSDRW